MADPATFDFYFEKADVDRDGKISGTEAIQFFKGSNLPQPILAKIWHAADNGHTGFLSRPEFYNALKLVTVAQSGRDLTPEIMRAALVGPASLKIPAPKIQVIDSQQQRGSFSSQVPAGPTQQPPAVATQQPPRTSFSNSQPGSISQTPRGSFTNTQTATPQQTPRGSFSNSQPYQAAAAAVAQASAQGVPRPGQRPSTAGYGLEQEVQRTSSGGFGDAWPPASPTTPGVQGQLFSSGPARSISSAVPNQVLSSGVPVQPSPALGASSQGLQDAFASSAFQAVPDAFPGDSFKVNSAGPASRAHSSTGLGAPALNAAPAGGSKLSGFDSPFGNDTFSANSTNLQPTSAQSKAALAPTSSATGKHLQSVTPQPTSRGPAPQNIVGAGQGNRLPAAGLGGAAWPKMTTSDVQRYSRVFLEVDTDRDAKITGAQARDLFLSWRLPREVLKQVWDLSDQDGDSMLSFREFCTALYLMERFREGRPLPPVLPAGFHFDDGSPQSIAANRIAEAQAAVSQHSAGYNLPSWQRNPRMLQPGTPGMMAMSPGLEPVGMQGAFQAQNRNAGSRHKVYQPNADAEGGDKVPGTDNKVLDSKEKLEFYRSKLQEIVLFKRKCDNRLAEITDRAAAEKREEEVMAKKYEEKYKQALEVNSRLVSEETAFREIQTRKLELRNAISEIERGGNSNALLQTRADRISNDLDELEKALAQRGQLLGFHVNGTTPVELPFGWQPSLQENAVDWDEEWDKFDDEGYTTIQDIMDQPKTSAVPGWDDGSIFADELDFSSEAGKIKDETTSAVESPRTESEAGSLKSGVDSPLHDLWSPKSQPLKRSMLGSSPLSAKADQSSAYDVHEEDSLNEPPSYASTASFDHGPSYDAGDHLDEKPWASVFTDLNANDDLGASWGAPSTSQPLAVKTRPGTDSLDFGSLQISSPASVNGEVKDEREFFGSKDWNDRSGDFLGSTSVPSTPLFKSDSPAKRASFFGEDSRLDSFASSQGRVSGVDDDSDPFADTGPFGAKSSDRWSTF